MDVPGSGLLEHRYRLGTGRPTEGREQIEQAVLGPGRDVEDLTAHRGRGVRSSDVRGHDVGHVREVATLESVTEDRRLLTREERRREERDDRGVGRVRPLARSEDVEEPQRHRLEREQLGEHAAVPLARELAHAVGRAGSGRGRLRCRDDRRPAVHAARRCEHDATGTGIAGGGEHRERAVCVHPVGRERIGDRPRDRPERGEVEHDVDVGDRFGDRIGVVDRRHGEDGGVGNVVTSTGREVVEHTHRVAVGDEPIDQVRTDEAGSAGHEHVHAVSPQWQRAATVAAGSRRHHRRGEAWNRRSRGSAEGAVALHPAAAPRRPDLWFTVRPDRRA